MPRGRLLCCLVPKGRLASGTGQDRMKKVPKRVSQFSLSSTSSQTKTCKQFLVEENGSKDDICHLICFHKVQECCISTASLNLKHFQGWQVTVILRSDPHHRATHSLLRYKGLILATDPLRQHRTLVAHEQI